MKFRGRARSRPARGRSRKAPRKTGEVPQHNAEQPDTTPNNDETDRHSAVPSIRISVDCDGLGRNREPGGGSMPRHWPSKRAGSERSPSCFRKCDMWCNRSHKISDMWCNRSSKAMTKIASRRWKCRSHAVMYAKVLEVDYLRRFRGFLPKNSEIIQESSRIFLSHSEEDYLRRERKIIYEDSGDSCQ